MLRGRVPVTHGACARTAFGVALVAGALSVAACGWSGEPSPGAEPVGVVLRDPLLGEISIALMLEPPADDPRLVAQLAAVVSQALRECSATAPTLGRHAPVEVRFDVRARELAAPVRTDLPDDASDRCVATRFEGQRIDALPAATRSGRVVFRLAAGSR